MKRYIKLLAMCLALALLGGSMPVFAGESEKSWHVGFGMAEFVPADYDPEKDSFENTYYIAGYNNGLPVTGILDPQCVRAAYISDGETAIVAAAVDCVGLTAQSIENIRERIAPVVEKYGLADVHIASTHTHAGIDTMGLWGPVAVDGKDDAFMEILYDAAAQAIAAACADATAGRLYFGSAFTGNIQRDSRLPNIYDKNIYRLRFEPADGSEGLQIISYDAHPEALRSQNTLVSADYPYYMGQKIKEKTGDDYVFFAGALGGLIMTYVMTDPATGREYESMQVNVVETGEYLADTILENTTERELAPSLEHAAKDVALDIENSAFVAMAFLGVLDNTPVEGGGPYSLALESRVSLMRLGGAEGVSVAMVPGELFPELAYGGSYTHQVNPDGENPTPMKEHIDGEFIVWGLCDDEVGYIVPPEDYLLHETQPYLSKTYDQYERRHYEETNCVGPGTAQTINDAMKELADELSGQ